MRTLNDLHMGWANVAQAEGIGVALGGMAIVFAALTLLAVSIALLPRVLRVVDRLLPEREEAPTVSIVQGGEPHAGDDDEVVAVIAAAIARHRTGSAG